MSDAFGKSRNAVPKRNRVSLASDAAFGAGSQPARSVARYYHHSKPWPHLSNPKLTKTNKQLKNGKLTILPDYYMKLVLKFEKDCSVPVAWCEVCDTEITDAGMAMVYWRTEAYRGGLHAPLLTHKRSNAKKSTILRRGMRIAAYRTMTSKRTFTPSSSSEPRS